MKYKSNEPEYLSSRNRWCVPLKLSSNEWCWGYFRTKYAADMAQKARGRVGKRSKETVGRGLSAKATTKRKSWKATKDWTKGDLERSNDLILDNYLKEYVK